MSLLDIFFWRKKRKELLTRMFNGGEEEPVYEEYSRLLQKRGLLIILICVIVFLNILLGVYYYNHFVNLYQKVIAVRADIESSLQMRENLIPVLITTVSDFVKHEDDIFLHAADVRADSIASGKNQPPDTKIGKGKSKIGDDWSNLLSKLFAVAERYPDLKTSESFQILMLKVTDAEKAIFDKRIIYNDAANKLNTTISLFPGKIVAFLFGFKQADYFQWKGEPEWVSTLKEKHR